MKRAFRLNKGNAMFLGVCSGIAEYTGFDVTLVRIGAVVVTLLGAFPWTLIAYGVVAWVAAPKQDRASLRGTSRDSAGTAADRRDVEQRLAEVDRYVGGSNHSLAREIDELR